MCVHTHTHTNKLLHTHTFIGAFRMPRNVCHADKLSTLAHKMGDSNSIKEELGCEREG